MKPRKSLFFIQRQGIDTTKPGAARPEKCRQFSRNISVSAVAMSRDGSMRRVVRRFVVAFSMGTEADTSLRTLASNKWSYVLMDW